MIIILSNSIQTQYNYMEPFGSEKTINRLHLFLQEFDINKESQLTTNRTITDCTAKLLGINNNNLHHNYKAKSIGIHSSEYYVPPRKGVDHALDLYFKSSNSQHNNVIGIKKHVTNHNIIVCERCAGHHDRKDCKATYFVCHMCGAKGHRMFQCLRAKCFNCQKLGHIANYCPFRK